MTREIVSNSSFSKQTVARTITSYDCGYEHSFDRYVDVKLLLQDADKEGTDIPATYASVS
jgi:hypothetical protein